MPFLDPIDKIFAQAPLFALVVIRVSGMVMLAPVLGMTSIPVQIKAMVVLVLSMILFPLVGPVASPPSSLAGLIVAAGMELLIGISMGFILMILFSGIELGANLISQQMGLTMAQLIDPMTEISTDVLGQLYMLMASLIYIMMNGHLILIQSLVRTFQTVPLMGASVGRGVLDAMLDILTTSFTLGIRVAGPALAAIFLATLAMGFISRTMPQLNILAAGFSIRIMLAMFLMIASLGSLCILCQDHLWLAFRRIGTLFI